MIKFAFAVLLCLLSCFALLCVMMEKAPEELDTFLIRGDTIEGKGTFSFTIVSEDIKKFVTVEELKMSGIIKKNCIAKRHSTGDILPFKLKLLNGWEITSAKTIEAAKLGDIEFTFNNTLQPSQEFLDAEFHKIEKNSILGTALNFRLKSGKHFTVKHGEKNPSIFLSQDKLFGTSPTDVLEKGNIYGYQVSGELHRYYFKKIDGESNAVMMLTIIDNLLPTNASKSSTILQFLKAKGAVVVVCAFAGVLLIVLFVSKVIFSGKRTKPKVQRKKLLKKIR